MTMMVVNFDDHHPKAKTRRQKTLESRMGPGDEAFGPLALINACKAVL
jgi:hypothetical protein